ncbi:MFS transporter [Kitasatospora sp. NPDC101155]|uniref:MFS transporter n=1 Tax=Kitasatospora sp. NPDC101155 TaxID=3364097 RepID=UPI003829900F
MSRWRGNPWAVLLVLALGFFMTLLDLTIVNIAIPDMVTKLSASLDQVLWISNAYVLVLAVALITAGRLGDLRGKKQLFIAGVALFTLASLLCGVSQGAAELIAARAVQGLGAAFLLPQTMSIIVETFPAERRGVALGIWGSVAGVSTVAGPTLGGLLVTKFDWRWIFFVNLPIGILVLLLAVPILPTHQRVERGRQRLDAVAVLIASAALFCLAFALTEGQRYEWNAWIWALIGLAAVLLVVFLVHQRARQDSEPLVPFVLFRDRNFTAMNVVAITVSFGVIALFLPMTIYLQSALGFSALKAGLVMAPTSVMAMLVAGPAGKLSDRFGGKYILLGGLVLFSAGTLWLLLVAEVGSSWTTFLPGFIVAGMGFGATFTPMATEAMRNVPPQLSGAASGVNNTLRQVGSVLATAAVGEVLQSRLVSALGDQAKQRAAELPEQVRAGFVQSFTEAGKSGLDVGAGQAGGAPDVGNLPPDLAHRVQELASEVFRYGFVDAMKPTMALPLAIVLAGAAVCLVVKGLPASRPLPSADSRTAAKSASAAEH